MTVALDTNVVGRIVSTKTAIVTGASSGIGEATALRLNTLGYTVYAAARRIDKMAPLAAAGIRTVKLDVTDDASLIALVDQVVAESGRVDVLVNNAGYGSYGALEDVPLDEARRQFEVNVFALARLTQLVLPRMRSQRSGHIFNVSSIGGKIYEPMGGWYHSTKFAVEGLSDSLRIELAPFGIHVVLIEPGAIATEWSGIASHNMLATSGAGAYAEIATGVARVLDMTDKRASKPKVVANTIVKALHSQHPRTRYAMGLGAKPMTYARRVLPDKAFDRLVRIGMRIPKSL